MTVRPRSWGSAPIGALALAGLGFLLLPLAGIVWRAPWSALLTVLREPGAGTALRLSLLCSTGAAVVSLVLGLPVAWVLARGTFRGRALVRAAALVPLVLPPVVGGVALLLAFGRRGLAGRWLYEWWGIQLPFTVSGAILAEAFVAMPFLVITAEAAFRNADRRLEAAARTLGARPARVFRTVTLPAALPGIAAGTALAWARALGEFGATVTFAGNRPGHTTTVPLEVYLLLESGDAEGAIVMSLVLLVLCVAVLVALRGRWLPGRSGVSAP